MCVKKKKQLPYNSIILTKLAEEADTHRHRGNWQFVMKRCVVMVLHLFVELCLSNLTLRSALPPTGSGSFESALRIQLDISGRVTYYLEKVKKQNLPTSNLKSLRIEFMLLFMLYCIAGITDSMIMMNKHLVSNS